MGKRSKILLSIVLPVRNEHRLMNLCSALSEQDHKDFFQVIIVDESDPEYRGVTVRCYEDLQRSGVNAKLILNAERRGVGFSMVQGLLNAEGDYVFFLDADNKPVKSFIKRVIEEILIIGNQKETIALSFLNAARYKRNLSNVLLLPRLYLSCVIGGLKYSNKHGFVNILRVFKREVLVNEIGVELESPTLSYLDNPNIYRKLSTLLANNVTRHIDEVLVEDVRHVFEDFSIKFLYARNKWYIKDKLKLLQSGKFSLKEKLSLLSSMLFYIAFLPIVLFTILGISAFFVINSFYAYMSFSLLLICYIAFFTFISWHKRIRLTKEVLLAITMLPLFLVVNSMLVYISLINIVKEKL
ncbi:glycosyltransferase family 2 protein [Saccharolobus sp.]|uniref:glycosyltransferase family 2 protein n=1 Tax=Saccharolobus sp. TaxID=2100761 RepID=UPI00316F1F0B